eukprot:4075915-Alexandrium_andersonii.AAC.1
MWMRWQPQKAPQGETSLPKAWNWQTTGTPTVAALGAGGAARSAEPSACSAETSGSPLLFPPVSSLGRGRFA